MKLCKIWFRDLHLLTRFTKFPIFNHLPVVWPCLFQRGSGTREGCPTEAAAVPSAERPAASAGRQWWQPGQASLTG
eukprot:scaffold667393_cov62-Prasinocladus_malaysianus.AAC.1